MGNVNWDLAGFTDELSRVGKRISGGGILVPTGIDLDLTTDNLVWSLTCPGKPKIIEPEPEILDQFVQLWRRKPQAILKFARTWGVLGTGLDSHSRLLATVLETHRQKAVSRDPEMVQTIIKQDLGIDQHHIQLEPLGCWRYFSHYSNALLNIAARLNQNRVGAIEDWECLRVDCKHAGDFGDFKEFSIHSAHETVEGQRTFISCQINCWLEMGKGVGFRLWPAAGSGWRIVVDYGGCVLGAIAFQLALTMSATESFFTCSGCGVPYMRRKKRPKLGESNFCESCHESGVALRNADRARRERIKQARQLRAEGLTISEIAKQVGARKLSTVRRWIEKGK